LKQGKHEYNFLRWSLIRRLANNEISKVIGLIPLAGYLILFNDGLADAIGFNQIAGRTANESSPFLLGTTSKLRLVFFGSIFLFLGTILFRLRSPKEIEVAQSELEFSDNVLISYSKDEIIRIETLVLLEDWAMRTDHVRASVAQLLKKPVDQISPDHLKPRIASYNKDSFLRETGGQYIRALAREWWLFQEHTDPKTRYMIWMACVLGYGMLALPTLDIAQAVLMDILRNILGLVAS